MNTRGNDESGLVARLRRNTVALISLAVALSGLGYNTWRNETTEAHRNTRQAAFVMLQELGELQLIVDQRFFAGQRDEISRIGGWGRVSMLRDMSTLVSPQAAAQAEGLFAAWESRLAALDAGEAPAEREISLAIAATRERVMRELQMLQ